MKRAPLVITTRDLGRRPGNSRALALEAPAPADLGTAVIAVPEGSPVTLELTFTSVQDGILVTGTAHVQLAGECVRCLEPLSARQDVELSELYLYPEAFERAGDDGDDEGVEMFHTDGELLDLEPMLRDAVVMSLPFQPLCSANCPGLCATCGVRLADAGPGHAHESVDPRLRVLDGFFDREDTP